VTLHENEERSKHLINAWMPPILLGTGCA